MYEYQTDINNIKSLIVGLRLDDYVRVIFSQVDEVTGQMYLARR